MANESEGGSESPRTSRPRISVVIPVFNNAAYIEQALQSVFDQNVGNTEIIVVDDGSTDETAEVLAKFSDRIGIIRQSNSGSAVARNVGLRETTGDYVAFLDADDWFLPGKFAHQTEILDANPDLGAVHSGWKITDKNGVVTKVIEPWIDAPELDLNTWLVFKPAKLGAMLFRRDWLQKVGGFDPELLQSQDVDLLLRLSLAGCTFQWQKSPTLCYRRHRFSIIRRNGLGQVKYATMVLDKFYSNPLVPSEIKRHERSVRYYSSMWLAWHLFHIENVTAATNQLQQTRSHSKGDLRRTAHDCLYHFTSWTQSAGSDPEDVRSMIDPLGTLGDENSSDPAELTTSLHWWLSVWWHYLSENSPNAASQLQHAPPLDPDQLLKQVGFYLRTGTVPAPVQTIDRFWNDAMATGCFKSTEQHRVTELYVTLCGRALYSGDLRIAWRALLRTIRFGWHPKAWPGIVRTIKSLLVELQNSK
ncbi:glycosyltransferase family 2 protein [Rhodopirellula sp. P2]|uniref:glycosyltransferase family 2 protein n=1 Tax=Rhodopirellula sp. P2 TaxID=2127060 RepID=UPI0023683CCF|nr:glycosyltransferase family A protein [Rhodopirellula sp. P2]WDQ17785.1 glycosyltransferase family A protein [Rhodopirellula sp. P2]